MERILKILVGCSALLAPLSHAQAEECTFTKAAEDMNAQETDAIYACLKDKLAAAYGKAGHEVASKYRNWKAASTRPATPGVHGERFLMTFVNDVGYDAYTDFKDEDVKMPIGTIIAKESFKANKKNKVAIGPLLIMTKLAEGAAPDFGDWKYSGVAPNGKEFKVSQKFCHTCHGVFSTQDSLGYPVEDVRVKK
ncbi:MAG: cytochrome P460 family protein [Hyphomicrobiaceae bacterium]